MGIEDLFSTRNQPLPDVYQYTDIPMELRHQIVHILQEVVGPGWHQWNGWQVVAKAIAKEHGLLSLPVAREMSFQPEPPLDVIAYLLSANTSKFFDVVEICFRRFARDGSVYRSHIGDGIDELNARLRRHGVGYEYLQGQIVRVDSQILHADAVLPALSLLSVKGFEGPNAEFLEAHEHLRHGRVEAAIMEACKAFESTMKVICLLVGQAADTRATAGQLIQNMTALGVVKGYSEEHLQNLAKCLQGVATVRNKDSGHGSGAEPRELGHHYAAYALHLAASNIVFLVEGYRALKAGL